MILGKPAWSLVIARKQVQRSAAGVSKIFCAKRRETKAKDLAPQIQEVLDSGKLPSHLADTIDGVRVIGNFAAHPIKSTHTGEVIEVELGEAEWLLDTLEGCFDFYFVQPAKLEKTRDALNKKLKEAGKPPLKGSPSR